MAESIIIHFTNTDQQEVEEVIRRKFSQIDTDEFRYPVDDYLVIVSPYFDFETEYEDSEKTAIAQILGSLPSVSFDFEIRRSKSPQACHVIDEFIRNELSDFTYIVDDMFTFWTKDQVLNSETFLDIYR